MKIKYLGTAAAEAIPAVFCKCETCRKSRALGGKNIRTRSQALIDGKLLIDLPCDTYMHSIIHGIDLSDIKSCIITHAHSDHVYPDELWCRGLDMANNISEPLTVCSTLASYRKLSNTVLEYGLDDSDRVRLKKLTPFVTFELEGYTITPLKAYHAPTTDPVIYAISKDGKNLLYANDTGFFPNETVKYLKESGICFDLISFDCTGGLIKDENYGNCGHLNLIGDIKMRELLKNNGNLNDGTVCVVNHFSHNGAPIHEEMEKAAAAHGFLTSYDGLELEF